MKENFNPNNYRDNLAEKAKDARKGSFFEKVTNPFVSKEERQRRIDEATRQVRKILEAAQATEEYQKAKPQRIGHNEISNEKHKKEVFTFNDVPLEGEIMKGSCVTAISLDVLPEEILKKVSGIEKSETGYVLKKYNLGHVNFCKQDILLFGGNKAALPSYPFDEQYDGNFNVEDQKRILERRQEEVVRYFAELPELVIPSHFFIQDDENKPMLFEVQKRLIDFVAIHDFKSDFLETPESKDQLLTESNTLSQLIIQVLNEGDNKTDPVFSEFIPDLNPTNIAVTQEGHLHVYDTNFFGFQWSSFIPSKVEKSLKCLQDIREKLEAN